MIEQTSKKPRNFKITKLQESLYNIKWLNVIGRSDQTIILML